MLMITFICILSLLLLYEELQERLREPNSRESSEKKSPLVASVSALNFSLVYISFRPPNFYISHFFYVCVFPRGGKGRRVHNAAMDVRNLNGQNSDLLDI